MTIDGRAVIAIETRPPIPETLHLLLEGGRDTEGRPWAAMRVVTRRWLHLRGSSVACAMDDHHMSTWLTGVHVGRDSLVRDLKLLACTDCGAVCVRDVSVDRLPGMHPGSLEPRRRDRVIGWYTGARPRQRVYA